MPEQKTATKYRARKRGAGGFTLIELLVAIAVTAVLLTLLFGPLVQSFFFTGQAQAEAAAQSTARTTMEQVSRELGSASGLRPTQGKFLNMLVMNKNGGELLARSYNAYIDIVPPRPQGGKMIDPTVDPTNPTVNLNPNTGAEENPPLILSIAPGTGFIRYFLGQKYPISLLFVPGNPGVNNEPQPYYNPYDESNPQIRTMRQNYAGSYVVRNGLTNTYVLYRAEVQPRVAFVNGNVTQYVPNTQLFSSVYGPNDPLGAAGTPEPDSQAKTDPLAQPVIDDPDFFRVVTAGVDINPITNVAYTAQEASDHNTHVYFWSKVAKPVIAASVADLIAPPRDARGNVVYDPGTGDPTNTFDPAPNPNAQPIPVMPTTVSFGPALISNDTLAATTNEYASQGFGSSQLDVTPPSGAPYIPSIYKAAYGQWQGTPVFTIYQNDSSNNPIEGVAATPYFITGEATPTDLTAALSNNPNLNRSGFANPQTGDLIEYDSESLDPVTNLPNHPVFDVTQSAPLQGVTHYAALTFDPAAGAANFAITAQPTNGNGYDYRDPNNQVGSPFWFVTPDANNQVNFTTLQGSYLNSGDPNFVPGAMIVPNSDRVYGPDMTYGGTNITNSTPLVPYTRVTAQVSAQLQANQYSVNYATGTFTFAPATASGPNALPAPNNQVQIAFSYQNNMNNTVTPFTSDTVRATYNTGSLTQVALGIRIYDTNSGRPVFFGLTNRLAVGNARR